MRDEHISVLGFLVDDHFALWDFADSFPAMRPDAAASRNALLIDLVEKELVEVTFGRWIENETVSLPVKHALAALRNPISWNRTGREPGHVLELTQAGRDFLRGKGIDLPF